MFIFLFIVISAAVFIAFEYNPISEIRKLFDNKKINIRFIMQQEKREKMVAKKISKIERHRKQTQQALKLSNSKMKYKDYIRCEILFCVIGILVGILLNNYFLSIVLGICLPYIPFQILQFKIVSYKKAVAESLESVLALLTNGYRIEDNFVAVVTKNMENFNEPFRQIFAEFLLSVNYIDTNIQRSIIKMRDKIDNPYFFEWCNMLMQCQDDRDLKTTLPNIVTKMNNVKRMQVEADSGMYKIWKEFSMIVIIAVAVVPLIRFLNREWFEILIFTEAGKMAIALTALVIFLSTLWVIRVNKPINIK